VIDDFRRIAVKKKNLVSSLILPFFTRYFDRKRASKRQEPIFIHDRCRKCKKCVDICPAKALSLDSGKIQLKEEKCIRCYCCHEMCPFDAIKID
jgi:Fe-S-cluster-containing hydrogenase component 2